ncbi:hypothetical protein ACR6C2_26105 [Streptomyces sp. INA 01156]
MDQGIAGACAASGRRMRIAYAALGLACALVLTGCGGDGGSHDDSAPGATPSAPGHTVHVGRHGRPRSGGTGSGGPDATGVPAGRLEGSWLTTAGARP